MKITNFSKELIDDLNKLSDWPDKVKAMQKNWIGISEGAEIIFKVDSLEKLITIYTTRPETIFGASFIALSVEHELSSFFKKDKNFINFKKECLKSQSLREENNLKISFNTNLFAIHPFTKKKIPIFFSNYVLMDYGSGAIFGCPAHDQRDYDFAVKYSLDIIPVIKTQESLPFIGDGIHINSDFLNGLNTDDAIKSCIKKLNELEVGEEKITFRIRDWGVSRQRYWGCPIPIIFCNSCGEVPVPEDHLPITLPEDANFDIRGNPLDNHPTWKYTQCPECNKNAIRETDTFDTFFESSWYFARFTDLNPSNAFTEEAIKYWMPVDQYIGGVEHAVMHLLYSLNKEDA